MASLNPDVEQTIYRVTQEAIENIVDHSRLEISPSVRKATVRPHLSSRIPELFFTQDQSTQ
jgi:signal transduction histidine kinase